MIKSAQKLQEAGFGVLQRGEKWFEVTTPRNIESPDWCGDVHVDWMEGCGNSPRIIYKQILNFPHEREPKAKWWYDPSMQQWRVELDGVCERLSHVGPAGLIWTSDHWSTPRQDGFGGRTFTIDAEGFGQIHLIGPFFGGQYTGWQEMTHVPCILPPEPYYRDKPWHQRGGRFGCYIDHVTAIRCLAKHAPHIPIGLVEMFKDYWVIEPINPAWCEPKDEYLRRK